MKIERTKNATRNISLGTFEKMHQFAFAFIIRTILIHFLGAEYLGLDSLYASILQVLNLAELGVGSAMVYSMYKPIAEDNKQEICALLKLYRRYYRIIGGVVLLLGLAVMPFLPRLIADTNDIPSELNLYVLYLLNLGATVLSYWLYSYKNCLLNAHQRNDVSSKIVIEVNTLRYIIQVIAIAAFKSYYVFLITALVLRICQNLYTAYRVHKLFPEYEPKGVISDELVYDINHKVRDLFTTKLGSVLSNSADSIVISALLGLKVVAIYNNYYYIMNAIMNFMLVIYASCTAGIGNSLVVETPEKNYKDLQKLTFLIIWLTGICSCCFLCLYQPFMTLWMGNELLLDFSCVVCLCINFYILEINQLFIVYKDAAGIWHKDRFRALITAIASIVLSVVLAQWMGILGILLATLISNLVIGMPWLIQNLFSLLFRISPAQYIKKLAVGTAVVLFSAVLCYIICAILPVTGIIQIAINLIVCVFIPSLFFMLIFKNGEELVQVKTIVLRFIRR